MVDVFISRRPDPALAPFIDRIWYYESAHSHDREVALPNAKSQLLVSVDPARPSTAVLRGVSTRPVAIDPRGMRRMVGVLFRAGGAAALSAMPARELRDASVALEDLRGSEARRLTDELVRITGAPAMLIELERWLVTLRLEPASAIERVDAAARRLAAGVSVANVITELGVSRSRFVREVEAQIGTSAKEYASLTRFQRAVRALAAGERDLASVAVACGYYDQSHFTHEFRRFAGRTPGAYRARDALEPNHMVD